MSVKVFSKIQPIKFKNKKKSDKCHKKNYTKYSGLFSLNTIYFFYTFFFLQDKQNSFSTNVIVKLKKKSKTICTTHCHVINLTSQKHPDI